MKNAISVTAVKTFAAVEDSPPVQKTITRISGAKIAVRLKTRPIEGFGISRPPRLTAGRTELFPSALAAGAGLSTRSEEHTSELQSLTNLVCRLLLEKK